MRIGVDATSCLNNRGYGRHARGLLGTLFRVDTENEYTFFVDSEELLATLPTDASVTLIKGNTPTAFAACANGRRSIADMWSMSRALSDSRFDLVFFPTVYSYVPVISRAKKVLMIHDVIPEKYPELTLPDSASRLFWKVKTTLGRWQADAVVTVSDFSREGIVEQFGLARDRVFVVGEACDSHFRVLEDPTPSTHLCSLGTPSNYRSVVYVGGFGPHKNLNALVVVFAKLVKRPEFADLRLILVGECGKEVFHTSFEALKNKALELGITERVIFTGFLTDENLVGLLNLSTVLVLPSLIEGFGLPAVEAAACGCPVIATTASPLPQLLGSGGLYVDPTKPEDLENALVRVLTSKELRRQMRAAGLAAARALSWEGAARQMIDVFRYVMSR